MVGLYKEGKVQEIAQLLSERGSAASEQRRLFKNVDGIKFLTHEGGCGGTRQDAGGLAGLLAGYIHHPNVAGATILSLGCQNPQVDLLHKEILKRDPGFNKPLLVIEQHREGSDVAMISEAIQKTFLALV